MKTRLDAAEKGRNRRRLRFVRDKQSYSGIIDAPPRPEVPQI
jgi:hypothetical protein